MFKLENTKIDIVNIIISKYVLLLFRVPYYNNTCMSSVLTQDHIDSNKLCVKIVC